jgi:hypothetical protein
MATQIPLVAGSYSDADPRASSKRLVGCMSEPLDQDSTADAKNPVPITMRRMAGINPLNGFNDGTGNPVRGMWEMAGQLYVVIGPELYKATVDAHNNVMLTPIGSGITGGSNFVRMTDNGACLLILQPGTSNAWTYTPFSGGGGFQQLTASFFTTLGALDCWFIDTFMVFLALNGETFFNDDGRLVSGNAQITFTTASSFTREFGTDPFVGMVVDHREALFFGSRTSEGYVNAGNPVGSPFSSAPDSFMQIGAHPLAGYTCVLQDQAVFWVANDKTVRRRNGQTPMRVSNSGIEGVLATVDLTGCYAFAPTVNGHPLYIVTIPKAGRSLCYDCLTQRWFELESIQSNGATGAWRPLCYYNGFGLQLVGDSLSSAVGFLDVTLSTEFGNPQICYFVTQNVYDNHNRINHRRVEIILTVGQSPSVTTIPNVDLLASDDSGKSFYSFVEPQTLGGEGENDQRIIYWNLGQSRDRAYMVRVTDATYLFTVDMNVLLEGGKW